jgi:hypothetical protein
MSLQRFAQDYEQLGPGEQAAFAEAVQRLLTDGLIWREDENDRKTYNFLVRRAEMVRLYLQVTGWKLEFHEPTRIYYLVHAEGLHRRRLSKELTIWLLVMRLLYAEKREKPEATLTRYPVVKVAEITDRYAAFFPNQRLRKKTSLTEALRALHHLKLMRGVGIGSLSADDPEKLVELLPALEVILPGNDIAALADRLREYQPTPDDEANEM